jgi:hypothetical protein
MTIRLTGHVDDQHRLEADVPATVGPGPVELLLLVPSRDEDEAGSEWATGVAREWATELSDPGEDIYTLADGEPVDAAG